MSQPLVQADFLEMRKTAETISTDDYEGGKTGDIIGETTIDPQSDFSLTNLIL